MTDAGEIYQNIQQQAAMGDRLEDRLSRLQGDAKAQDIGRMIAEACPPDAPEPDVVALHPLHTMRDMNAFYELSAMLKRNMCHAVDAGGKKWRIARIVVEDVASE